MKISPPKQHPLTTEILGNKTTCRILVSGSKAIFFCSTCMYSLACGLLKHVALTAAGFFAHFLFEVQHQWVNRLVDSIKTAGTGNKQGTISKSVWVNYIISPDSPISWESNSWPIEKPGENMWTWKMLKLLKLPGLYLVSDHSSTHKRHESFQPL